MGDLLFGDLKSETMVLNLHLMYSGNVVKAIKPNVCHCQGGSVPRRGFE